MKNLLTLTALVIPLMSHASSGFVLTCPYTSIKVQGTAFQIDDRKGGEFKWNKGYGDVPVYTDSVINGVFNEVQGEIPVTTTYVVTYGVLETVEVTEIIYNGAKEQITRVSTSTHEDCKTIWLD